MAFVLDGDGRHVATIHGGSEERMARARLIAAAPDLLDAAMALITTFGTMDAQAPADDPGRSLSEFADPRLLRLTDDQLFERANEDFRAALMAIVRAIVGDDGESEASNQTGGPEGRAE